MLRLFLLLGIITTALASGTLDQLDSAAQSFAAAIDQQITIAQSDPSPAALAENTIAYADAKISYFNALRAAMPDLTNIATGREPRPPEVDKFRDAFRVAGEIQEIAADKETAALLKRYGAIPRFQKAAAQFDRAQKVEERFQRISTGKTSLLGKAPHLAACFGRRGLPVSD